MKHWVHVMLVNLCLMGCTSNPPVQPPPPPPTVINLQFESAANLNADSRGNGAPVMLRVYELREQSNFNTADFFALFNNEKATLGGDLLRKQELLLQPGETKTLSLSPDDAAQSVGFFAAFRALDTAKWRALVDVKAHQTQTIHLKLDNNQLLLNAGN